MSMTVSLKSTDESETELCSLQVYTPQSRLSTCLIVMLALFLVTLVMIYKRKMIISDISEVINFN